MASLALMPPARELRCSAVATTSLPVRVAAWSRPARRGLTARIGCLLKTYSGLSCLRKRAEVSHQSS
jgi:hypothetical protein